MNKAFAYTFPAIRGIQAGREYYASMCPMGLIPKIFLFDESEVPPEVRAQRNLNKSRVPQITNYLVENRESYIFSALTASVDGEIVFEPFSDEPHVNQLGLLTISMNAKFVINDGQHRRAAIEAALKKSPDLSDETIAVVFFVDAGLSRAQQMFADLNRYAVRPSSSLNVLYDHRDALGEAVSLMVVESDFFDPLVERHQSSLSARAKKLFTLSGMYSASKELISDIPLESREEHQEMVEGFWYGLMGNFPDWQAVRDGSVTAGDIRDKYIHCFAVTLQALGRVGNCLVRTYPDNWQERLQGLQKIDWRRDNPVWQGRPLFSGSMRNSAKTVMLTANTIKKELGLPLTDDEKAAEQKFKDQGDE